MTHYVNIYVVLILFQSFDKKGFDCNNNAIYPTFFCLLIQLFSFSYDKDIRATNSYCNYSFLSFLPNLALYSYNHILKIPCVPASWQSGEFKFFWLKFVQKMDLGLEFQKTNLNQHKNQHPQDLDLKFEKTNIEIRINIFEILCACARVPIFRQNKQLLTFSAQICPKVDIGLAVQKTIVGIRFSILDIPCVPIVSQNEQLWIFRPKFVRFKVGNWEK